MTFKEEKLQQFAAMHHEMHRSTSPCYFSSAKDFLAHALAEQKARILEVLWSERGSFEQMDILDRIDLKITNL